MTPENRSKIASLLQEVSTILLGENYVQGGDWSFDGWTTDGRAVKHKFHIGGHERVGQAVARQMLERESSGWHEKSLSMMREFAGELVTKPHRYPLTFAWLRQRAATELTVEDGIALADVYRSERDGT